MVSLHVQTPCCDMALRLNNCWVSILTFLPLHNLREQLCSRRWQRVTSQVAHDRQCDRADRQLKHCRHPLLCPVGEERHPPHHVGNVLTGHSRGFKLDAPLWYKGYKMGTPQKLGTYQHLRPEPCRDARAADLAAVLLRPCMPCSSFSAFSYL